MRPRLHLARHRSETGSSGVEYGLMISVVVLVITAAIAHFGEMVSVLYDGVF